MAYQLTYFFDRGGSSPESVLVAAIDWLRVADLDASLGELSRGTDWDLALDWVAGDLRIDGVSAGITIEVHGDAPMVAEEWRAASAAQGAPSRSDVTSVCFVTLSGETHDGALRALRDYWRAHQGASEFDEQDGFTTS